MLQLFVSGRQNTTLLTVLTQFRFCPTQFRVWVCEKAHTTITSPYWALHHLLFITRRNPCVKKKEKKTALQNTVSKHPLTVEHQRNKTHINTAEASPTIYLFGLFKTKDERKGLSIHVKMALTDARTAFKSD